MRLGSSRCRRGVRGSGGYSRVIGKADDEADDEAGSPMVAHEERSPIFRGLITVGHGGPLTGGIHATAQWFGEYLGRREFGLWVEQG